ncbi:phage holin family protein [Propionibacteriaceae bacterium G1746]
MTQPDTTRPQFEAPRHPGEARLNTGYGSRDEQTGGAGLTPQLNDIITALKTDGTRMVQDNLALAQAEVKPMVVKGGIGGGLFAGAAYFVLSALWVLFMAGGFGFSKMWQAILGWSLLPAAALGFVTMGIVMILVAAALGAAGYFGFIKKIEKPEATIAEVKADIEALKSSIQRGQQAVAVNVADRAALKADKKAVAQMEDAAHKAARRAQ